MEYTIEITQFCENNCNYCSTNATTEGKHMSLDSVIDFLLANNIQPTDRINISGGEPLAHPYFYEILKACYTLTTNVWIYTNMIRQIKYNAEILAEGITVEANLCLHENCLEKPITVPKGTKVNLLKFVPTGRGKDISGIDVHVSGNMRDECLKCEHKLLQADGKIVQAPCKKQY